VVGGTRGRRDSRRAGQAAVINQAWPGQHRCRVSEKTRQLGRRSRRARTTLTCPTTVLCTGCKVQGARWTASELVGRRPRWSASHCSCSTQYVDGRQCGLVMLLGHTNSRSASVEVLVCRVCRLLPVSLLVPWVSPARPAPLTLPVIG